MTQAEHILWREIRGRRLVGAKFKRQWTLGRYIVDFCCIEAKLVVEVDGGQHNDDRDAARTAEIEAMGYRVTRFWNNEVMDNLEGVLQVITAALSPNPLPRTGEGMQ